MVKRNIYQILILLWQYSDSTENTKDSLENKVQEFGDKKMLQSMPARNISRSVGFYVALIKMCCYKYLSHVYFNFIQHMEFNFCFI